MQAHKSANGEVKYVNTFATKVIQPILDKLLAGETVKSINNTFFKETEKVSVKEKDICKNCPICNKNYKTEKTLKTHMMKYHKGLVKQPESDESSSKRDDCRFNIKNRTRVKSHKNNIHEKAPRSPAKKRQKTAAEEVSKDIVEELIMQIHDATETEAETDKELKELEKLSFEEIRIDEQFMDDKKVEKLLSDQRDQKILDKQRKEDEEEASKQKALNRNLELLKGQEVKKRKRDNSLKYKKKVRSIENSKLPKGFKHIPSNLKVHFPKDHVLLLIDADGACGISGGAAHMFADKSQGKALRR